jgi:DNA-binding response OmpR family regulator
MIEDTADYRDIITYYLGKTGFTVTAAHDGRDGLEKARRESYDLIITDLMLPAVSGYEICTLLKQDARYHKTPIIVLTASKLQPKDEQLAKECGADAFFPKSIEPKLLVTKIQELISGISAPPAPSAAS